MSLSRHDRLVAAMPVVFVLIWSTGFIVARYGMPHSPPMKFLAMRYALSIVCLALWALWARVRWPGTARELGHLCVTGVLMQAGYLGGVWSAVWLGMGAGLVALLAGLQPVLTALWISWRGARVSVRQWAGLTLGFAGLALVVWQKLGIGEVNRANFLLALGALLSITIGTLYQKRFVTPADVRAASLVQAGAALVVTLPLAWLEPDPMNWNTPLAGAMAWSVLVLTLGGSSLFYLLIQRGAAMSVTSLLYLVPPCTASMAWLLFDEPLTGAAILGMGLAALGVSLVVRAASKPASRPQQLDDQES